MTKPMANKIKKLPQTEKAWIYQFKNIYGKEPTERELRCYINYKKTGYCGQNTWQKIIHRLESK